MLMLIWMSVMTSAFVPGGPGIVARQGAAVEAHVLACYESALAPVQSIDQILRRRAPGNRRMALAR